MCNNFVCFKCGSEKLMYEKWVKCQEKVIIHHDGHIEYVEQKIDDNNVLRVECRYVCSSCGEPPMLYGDYITTEDDLKEYLEMSLEERAEMQADFEQMQFEQAKLEEKKLEDEEIL